MPSRLVMLKRTDTGETASWLLFLIPDADNGLSDGRGGFSGVALYATLAGIPVCAGRYDGGMLVGSASLLDESHSWEENACKLAELLPQDVHVVRIRPGAGGPAGASGHRAHGRGLSAARELEDDPCARAYHIFHRQQQHVRDCDILIANLNDFHGWEPDSDTAFECGMAFQLGKKLYGYMDSAARMIDRVPQPGARAGVPGHLRMQCGEFRLPHQHHVRLVHGYSGGGRHRCHDQGGGGAARAVTRRRPAGKLLAPLRRF